MSIARHTTYNLVGSLVPVAIALITVPIYLHLVGADRYGVLAIAWLLLGYFGLFDLGLGRAATYQIAALKDAPDIERAQVFWSAVIVNIGMGLVGAAVLWPVAHYFFAHVFKVSDALRPEIIASVPLLAASVPVATLTGVLSGALIGRSKFLEANFISVSSTILFQLLPLVVAWLAGPHLFGLLTAALAARVVAIVVLWIYCQRVIAHGHPPSYDAGRARSLLGYGGWVTLTAIFGPALVIVDRFAIGAVLGATAVAIYSVSFQLAQRISILPSALVAALFPRLPTATPAEQGALSRRAFLALASVLGVPILASMFLLHPFLDLWVGRTIGGQASGVGRVIILGFWVNAFAVLPYTRLQATGRPDLVTKVLIAQIPVYLVCLYVAMKQFGLMGCAAVFSIRCAADYALMSVAATRRIEHLPLLLLHTGPMGLALICATLSPYGTPLWWVEFGVLAVAMSALCWITLPREVKEVAFGVLRARLPKRQLS